MLAAPKSFLHIDSLPEQRSNFFSISNFLK
jgi:hypothetical protein